MCVLLYDPCSSMLNLQTCVPIPMVSSVRLFPLPIQRKPMGVFRTHCC